MTQGVKKNVRTVAAVKAKAHLVQVGLQMLCAKTMPRPDDAALEERKCGLDRISMNIGSKPDVFSGAVSDRLMLSFADRLAIGAVFVGHDYVNILGDVLLDELLQRAALGIFGVEETNSAAALANSKNNLFVTVSESGLSHTAPLVTTDVGFIDLDSTVKQGALRCGHSATYAMAEIPCGLIGAFVVPPEGALELQCAHPLFGFAEQYGSHEPFEQRQVGIVEDRSSGNSELVITILAVEQLAAQPYYFASMASDTLRAERPAQAAG